MVALKKHIWNRRRFSKKTKSTVPNGILLIEHRLCGHQCKRLASNRKPNPSIYLSKLQGWKHHTTAWRYALL